MTKYKSQDRSGVSTNVTNNSLPEDKQKRIANGIQRDKEIGLMYLHPLYQLAGAIYSTVNDLRKYLSANIGLMNKAITDLMHCTRQKRHSLELC